MSDKYQEKKLHNWTYYTNSNYTMQYYAYLEFNK